MPTGLATSTTTAAVDTTRYVNKVDDTGWLRVLDETGASQYLCEYTKIKLLPTPKPGHSQPEPMKGRTRFRVMDGTNRGKACSLKDENVRQYLGVFAPASSPVTLNVTMGRRDGKWHSVARNLDLDQQLATGTIDKVTVAITLNSNWGPPDNFTPIPPGTYDIGIPDYPHSAAMTRYYRDTEPSLMYDQVWFPIKYGDGSRYVHVGNVSDGCVTVLSLDKWVSVYNAMIRRRDLGTGFVGRLVVTASAWIVAATLTLCSLPSPGWATALEDAHCQQSLPPAESAACEFVKANDRIGNKDAVKYERQSIARAQAKFRSGDFIKASTAFGDASAYIPTAYARIMAGNARFMAAASPPRPPHGQRTPAPNECYAADEFGRLVDLEVPQTYRVGLELAKLSMGHRPVQRAFVDDASRKADCLERLAATLTESKAACVDYPALRACMGVK